MDLPSGFIRLAWSNLAAQSAEQIGLAAAMPGGPRRTPARRVRTPAGLGRFTAGRLLRTARLAPGSLARVFGRFLVGARVVIPPLSGHSRMTYPRFVALEGLGAVLWVGALVLAGYAGGPRPSSLLGIA